MFADKDSDKNDNMLIYTICIFQIPLRSAQYTQV